MPSVSCAAPHDRDPESAWRATQAYSLEICSLLLRKICLKEVFAVTQGVAYVTALLHTTQADSAPDVLCCVRQ